MTDLILRQLFPAVWNMSLTAGIIILFLLPVRLLLRRAPKVFSYVLWAVVLFRLLCPVSIAAPHSLLGLVQAPARETTAVTSTVEFVRPSTSAGAAPSTAPAAPQQPTVSEEPVQPAPSGTEPVEIAALIWLAGIVGMLAYSAVSLLRLRRQLVGAAVLTGNIYQADHIGSPFVMGLLRPRIYLPSALEQQEQAYIILHEQHHIRRLDHITRQLAFAALCLHWFNPLVWLAFVLSGRDMEMSCDEAVIRQLGSAIRADYSQSLLRLTVGRPIIAGAPLSFGEGSTKSRIRNLLHWRRPRVWITALAGVLCVAAIAACAANPGGTGSGDSTSTDVDQAREESWSSVEAYVQHLMNTKTEVSYYVLGDPVSEQRTAPVTDRRLAYLKSTGQVAGLAPGGILEAWEFNYLLQFDEDPDTVALRRDDGSYEILYDAPVNDGGDFFGCHDTVEEAIYDWYVQYAGLDLPLYVEDWTGRFAQPEGFSMGNYPVHRYDVNGGYLYIPVSGWIMQEPSNRHWEWYSEYDTGSGLVVDYFTNPVEDEYITSQKQGFAPLDDTRQVWERRRDGYNSQYWLYPAADGIGCWRVWAMWTDEGITNYPYIAIEPEVMALMAASFTPAANTVSAEARAVLETAITAPNTALFTAYGAEQGEQEAVRANWEQAAGAYFADGAVAQALDQQWLNAFQLRSRDFNRGFAVSQLTLVQRSSTQEVVDVAYTSDGEPHRIRAVLTKNADGKFTGISYTLSEGGVASADLLAQLLGGSQEPDQVGQVDQAAIDLAAARQRLLAESDRLWIALSSDSVVSGRSLTLVLDVYNPEDALAQQLTCAVGLDDSATLLDVLHTPEDFLLLEEVDGTDRLRVLMDASQTEPTYRTFLWDTEAGMFAKAVS